MCWDDASRIADNYYNRIECDVESLVDVPVDQDHSSFNLPGTYNGAPTPTIVWNYV
jgi:hypothetical protein